MMGWSQTAQAALFAVSVFTSDVSAQGFYASVSQEVAACGNGSGSFPFVAPASNCYTGLPVGPGTTLAFQVKNYVPANGVSGYQSLFPGYWGSVDSPTKFNSTIVPQACAQACRGYGYKIAVLGNTPAGCFCGTTTPSGKVSVAAATYCRSPCTADKTQGIGGSTPLYQCGGSAAGSLYIDPSFASEAAVASYQTSVTSGNNGYQYLGCFYSPNFSASSANAATESTQGSMQLVYCTQKCAQIGYPMATMSSTGACSCGASFGPGSWQVNSTQDPTSYGYCSTSCDG